MVLHIGRSRDTGPHVRLNGHGKPARVTAGRRPQAVTGSPLTKVVGQPVAVGWRVRNSGGTFAMVEMYLTDRSGLARFRRTGPLAVSAGVDLPLSLSWETTALAPGVRSITIGVDLVNSAGDFIQNLGAQDASINLVSPAPAAPQLFVVGDPSIS